MDVIKEKKNGKIILTYKVIGGIFDFRFFMNEQTPFMLLYRFTEYLGKSAVPPFWALGFHQSRWGYQNVSMLEDVLANYKKHGLPLDGIWSDIDYMLDF